MSYLLPILYLATGVASIAFPLWFLMDTVEKLLGDYGSGDNDAIKNHLSIILLCLFALLYWAMTYLHLFGWGLSSGGAQ